MLGLDRQGQVVPVATSVTDLVAVVSDGENGASARFADAPAIGVAAVLLIAVKMVPAFSLVFATAVNLYCAPLAIVTPLAVT